MKKPDDIPPANRTDGECEDFDYADAASATGRVRVWTWRPHDADARAPVIVVMHGYKRNARTYRDDWIPHAADLGAIVLAPELDQEGFPGPRAYEVGQMRTPDRKAFLPPEVWSFGVVERTFDEARRRFCLHRDDYWLYGHSAGGQFVHRLALFLDVARFSLAVAANAGAYTIPRAGERFPYGLDGFEMPANFHARAFSRPLVVAIGAEDTDTGHHVLLKSPEAMRQGPHRFGRGRTFHEAAYAEAGRLGVPIRWNLVEVPGVGHSNRGMARAAAALFAGRTTADFTPARPVPATVRAGS